MGDHEVSVRASVVHCLPSIRFSSARTSALALGWRYGIIFGVPDAIVFEVSAMKQFKIIVEKHPDTYVAYPLGLKGIVVGQGETYEAALADAKSAIQFHVETFGPETLEVDPPVLEVFVAEAGVPI